MNTKGIETLLEKYYEGLTTLQEEKILRDFFQGQEVPAHLKSHQSLFIYCGFEQHHELNDRDFEQKLSRLLSDRPTEIPVIPMKPGRSRLVFITGIAAGVLLLAGLFYTFQQDVFKLHQSDNPDCEIAYAEASQALMLVSSNLNTGMKQVERLQMVDKAMKNVQLFNKFYQYQTIIINPDENSNQSIKSK
jgi:hypothetical protein